MRDSRPRSFPLSAALLVATVVAPGALSRAQSTTQSADSELSEAELIKIEVVVNNRGGDPVAGLEMSDFEAAIDGVQAPVIALSAPPVRSSDEAPPADRNLSLLLYVDNVDIDIKRRAEVFERLTTVIEDSVGELDRIMVVAAHAETALSEQSFTREAALITEALDRIEQSAPLPQQDTELEGLLREIERMLGPAQNRLDPESERDSQTVAQQLRAYAALQGQRTLATCDRLEEAVNVLASLPGRRAIIYVGSGMPLNPGEDLLQAVKSARPAIREEGPFESPNNSMPVELGESTAQAVTALGRYASLNDVTFYSFDIGRRAAIMTAASADVGIADVGSSQPGENFNRPAATFGRQSDLEDSLRIVAAETGGVNVRKHQAVDRAIGRLLDGREGAYTLAFARPDGAPGSPHSIKISTSRKRLDVRHRRSFRIPDGDDLVVERLRTALLGGQTSNPLEASVMSESAGPLEGNSYDVHLSIRVPVENLALEPLEQSHKAQVTVFLAASDGDLWTSPIQKVVVPITIPNDEMLSTMGRTLDYELDIRIFSGREQIALAVHDDIDPRMSILTLTAPQPGDGDPPGR